MDLGQDQAGRDQLRATAQRGPEEAARLGMVLITRAEERDPALLSAHSGPRTADAMPRSGLGNQRLREMAVDLLAQIGRKPLHHPAGYQQRVLRR
jgi:hypothetical protein